jgi:hypothetical protein
MPAWGRGWPRAENSSGTPIEIERDRDTNWGSFYLFCYDRPAWGRGWQRAENSSGIPIEIERDRDTMRGVSICSCYDRPASGRGWPRGENSSGIPIEIERDRDNNWGSFYLFCYDMPAAGRGWPRGENFSGTAVSVLRDPGRSRTIWPDPEIWFGSKWKPIRNIFFYVNFLIFTTIAFHFTIKKPKTFFVISIVFWYFSKSGVCCKLKLRYGSGFFCCLNGSNPLTRSVMP